MFLKSILFSLLMIDVLCEESHQKDLYTDCHLAEMKSTNILRYNETHHRECCTEWKELYRTFLLTVSEFTTMSDNVTKLYQSAINNCQEESCKDWMYLYTDFLLNLSFPDVENHSQVLSEDKKETTTSKSSSGMINCKACPRRFQYQPQQHDRVCSSCAHPLPLSCGQIKSWDQHSPSAFYELLDALTNERKTVYCNMEEICRASNGWRRIGYFNISDQQLSNKCPPGLREYKEDGVKACGRHFSMFGSCGSVVLPTLGLPYTEVCGRVYGYQYYSTNAVYHQKSLYSDIDSHYVDGVSLTYGISPREHIWTFMASEREDKGHSCPCSDKFSGVPPGFIGNDYFCESGCTGTPKSRIYKDDVLWDGSDCGPGERSCCQAPGLPWFHKILDRSVFDDIELRVCGNSGTYMKDVGLIMYEIYVH